MGMIPHERSLVQRLQGRKFALLGVNDDDPASYRKGVAKEPTNWRNWQDGHGGPISTRWAIAGYPEVYIIDARGIIRYREKMSEHSIDDEVEALLKEAEAEAAP